MDIKRRAQEKGETDCPHCTSQCDDVVCKTHPLDGAKKRDMWDRAGCTEAAIPLGRTVKQRGGLTAATETVGKFDLAASASAMLCTAETGSRDAVGLQCPKIAPFTLKVAVKYYDRAVLEVVVNGTLVGNNATSLESLVRPGNRRFPTALEIRRQGSPAYGCVGAVNYRVAEIFGLPSESRKFPTLGNLVNRQRQPSACTAATKVVCNQPTRRRTSGLMIGFGDFVWRPRRTGPPPKLTRWAPMRNFFGSFIVTRIEVRWLGCGGPMRAIVPLSK
jgi:hypothetical protein